jgi:hypothetical protein
VPNSVHAGVWLVSAVLLSWIAVGFMGAALALFAVAMFPIQKERLWVAAAACLLVSCLMGILLLGPAWVLWGYLDEWAPLIDFLEALPRN